MQANEIRYGKPGEKEPYIKEFYCAMHNAIPVTRPVKTFLAPCAIEDLFPMQVVEESPATGERKIVNVMVCRGCIVHMRTQLTEQLKLPIDKAKRILRDMRELGEKDMKPPEDSDPGQPRS